MVMYSSGFTADVLAERPDTSVDGFFLHKKYQRAEFITAIRSIMEAVAMTVLQLKHRLDNFHNQMRLPTALFATGWSISTP